MALVLLVLFVVALVTIAGYLRTTSRVDTTADDLRRAGEDPVIKRDRGSTHGRHS